MPDWRQHHAVNSRNEIASVLTWSEDTSTAFPDGYTRTFLQDRNGNLVTDGLFVYQYDAFNRLLQINQPGSAAFDTDGRIVSGLLGSLVLRYQYDAFGRLIRKHLPLLQSDYQTEDHYYDGVRRIQTVGYRYEDPTGPGFGPGGAFGEGEGELGEVGTQSPPVETHWTEREYVYGPDYVDEFVAEFDQDGAPLFFLQDANYNVVALTDADGAIVEQRVYEPYGELAAGETFGEHGVSRVGHQGLFFERTGGDVDDPPIAPGALGFYYNRNRMYSPTLGRFMQRDPNETALPIMTAMSMNGSAMDILFAGFNSTGLYGDGMNLFQYLGSNPISGLDPSGLDMFDDAIDDLGAQTVAAIGMLNEGARIASIGLGLALDLVGAVTGLDVLQSVYVIATGGGGFWEALDIFMTVNPIGHLAKAGGKIGRGFNKLFKARRIRVLGALCFAAGTIVEMADGSTVPIESVDVGRDVCSTAEVSEFAPMVQLELSQKPDADLWRRIEFSVPLHDGMTMTIVVLRPMEWINRTGARQDGSIFLSMPEMHIDEWAIVKSIGPCPELESGRIDASTVTGIFVTPSARVLDLFITEFSEPIGVTAGHRFRSIDRCAWVAASDLRVGETLRTLEGTATVAALKPRFEREFVYNLEVYKDHTYYVSKAKLWAHNNGCGIPAFTRLMKSRAKRIATGPKIDVIDRLLSTFGGERSKWRKMKTWTEEGLEVHWYEHDGIGKKLTKWAGDPDPW